MRQRLIISILLNIEKHYFYEKLEISLSTNIIRKVEWLKSNYQLIGWIRIELKGQTAINWVG